MIRKISKSDFVRTTTYEKPICPYCKKKVKAKDLAVGHIRNFSVVDLAHDVCQQANEDRKYCFICMKKFKPLPPLSKTQRVFLDNASEGVLFRSWEEGIRVLQVRHSDLLLKATEEQLQRLSLFLRDFIYLESKELEWFINLPESQAKAFRPLGTRGMVLPESERTWFLEQSEMRQKWIISYCSPYNLFIPEQREWLESLTDEEMRKTAPLLDEITPFLKDWNSVVHIGSKIRQIALILQMTEKGILANLLHIKDRLSEDDQTKLRLLYALDAALYHAVKKIISPRLSAEDRQWLDIKRFTSSSAEYQLIKRLHIPHREIQLSLDSVIEGSWEDLDFPEEHKDWLCQLTPKGRRSLLRFETSDLNIPCRYFRLRRRYRNLLRNLCHYPEEFFKSDPDWVEKLQKVEVLKAYRSAKIFCKPSADPEVIYNNYEFLKLPTHLQELLFKLCGSPGNFYKQKREWVDNLKEEEVKEVLNRLPYQFEKKDDPKQVCQRYQFFKLPQEHLNLLSRLCTSRVDFYEQDPVRINSLKKDEVRNILKLFPYNRKAQAPKDAWVRFECLFKPLAQAVIKRRSPSSLTMEEKEWLQEVASKDNKLFRILIKHGISKKTFLIEELRGLSLEKSDLEHIEKAHKKYWHKVSKSFSDEMKKKFSTRQMRKKGTSAELLSIKDQLSEHNKTLLSQLYAYNNDYYKDIKKIIYPKVSEEDRQWLDKLSHNN